MRPTIVTHSGIYFDLENPTPDMVCIDDIAHALSHLCRYTGHTREFYSVGQHSVHVSEILPSHLQLVGLLHDATEAYVGDVSRPLKMLLPEYRVIEDRVWGAIAEKFGLPPDPPPAIKNADNTLLITEKRDLLDYSRRGLLTCENNFWAWADHIQPLPGKIQRWPSWMAKKVFLERFQLLAAV